LAALSDFALPPFSSHPATAGRRHFSRRSSLSISDFGSPPPPADFVLGRRSHPKIVVDSFAQSGG
jgi:hypothetical protein